MARTYTIFSAARSGMLSPSESLGLALSMLFAAGISCSETTGPETVDPPAGVAAALISPTSARITWTASAQSERVTSYNVFRNGAKVAEVQTTSHVDEGLVELTSYMYTVSANGRDGVVSALSAASPSAAVTPPDITGPRVIATTPAAAAAVPRATTLRATFSEAMAPATINTSTFLVRTSSGSDVAGSVTYLPAIFAVEFVPASGLPNASGIAVTITTGVRDQAGNAMTAAFEFAFAVRDEIPPSVSSVNPADRATDIPVGTSAVIVFGEAMDAATIDPSSITLSVTATGAAVSGSVSYDAASHAATFIPAAPLNSGSSYTVGVSTAVRDAAGNALTKTFASSFEAARVVDPPDRPPVDKPPSVIASSPANGSEAVPVTSPVSVTFGQAMIASTINGATFTLTASGAPVSGTVTYDAASRVASFRPSAGLLAEVNHVATVTKGVRDVAGNPLASDFVFAFRTLGSVDKKPLAIVSRTPSSGATGVDRATTVRVEFSETVNASTVNGTTFFLSCGASCQVAVSVTYNAETRTATLIPNGPLYRNRSYTATVTTGVKDAAGNAFGGNDSFSFTTGVLPTEPDPRMAGLFGMVIDDSGGCIPGATVRVVSGQAAGQTITQDDAPCSVWDYDGGFYFENLIPGVEMTFQASAPGYSVYEKRFIPSLEPGQTVVEFKLSRH